MTAKFCTNCGAELGTGQFCSACGAHVAETGGEQAVGSAGESPTVAPAATTAAIAATGSAAPAPPPPPGAVPPTVGGVPPAAPPPAGDGSKKLAIILGVAIVAALLILGGILLLTRVNSSTPASSSQSPSTVTLPSPTQATSSAAPTPTSTVTATATATVTAAPPVVPVQPDFAGCPSGFTYIGQYGGYNTCRNGSISDGFAANIASAVNGPGSYSGVYSPARDKEYYFRCVGTGGASSPIDCGYQPTNIANGGLVRLYPIG